MALLLACALMFGALHVVDIVSAATVHTIPDANIEAVKCMTPVVLGGDNLESYEWSPAMAGMGDVYEYPTGSGKSFAVKANTVTGKTYSGRGGNLLTLKFSNVMTVNKRAVNATITIKEIKIYRNKTSGVGNRDIYVSFMTLNPTNIWVGAGQGYENDDWVSKEVTFETSFTWADTGQNVLTSIPMCQALNDVDSYYGEEGVLDEGWKGNSGYTKDIYTFDKCGLNVDTDNMEISLSKDLNTIGDDIWTVSGALVPLQSGTISLSQTFYEYACATGILFYSPYDDQNMPMPTKQADNSKVYEPGNTIIWNIEQKVHTYQADIFGHYSSFTFTDVLPEEVTFESAKLYHNNKDVTEDYGILSYDSDSRIVKYMFSSDTLKNDGLYNGGTLKLQITTKALNDTKNVITVTNNAATTVSDRNYSDLIQSTNEVSVKINPAFDITTEIDHGTITDDRMNIKKGENHTVTWTLENGYYIYSVTVDDKLVEADGSYTFTDINSDHKIIVTTRPYYKITTVAEHGSIDKSVAGLKQGDEQTINFRPDEGYYLEAVKVDGKLLEVSDEMDSYTFSDIQDNHLIEVKYAPYFRITGEIDYGTIFGDIENIRKGESHTVTWTPEEGRYTGNVTVDGKELVVTGGSYTFSNIGANHSIVVKTLPYHQITTGIDNGFISERIVNIKDRESKLVSWTPKAGYYVSAVKIDGKIVYMGNTLKYPTSYEFSDINTNHHVLVETKIIPNLVITKEADKDVYNVDDEITYTITAQQTVEGAAATNVLIVDKDKTKGLEFNPDTVQCSDETAKITKEKGTFAISLDELAYGDTVTITVKGKVTKAELESSDINNTVTIKSDQTEEVSADKKVEIWYNIITAVENGTIDDSISDLKYGDEQTINFRPEKGYYLEAVKVDGNVLEVSDEMDSYTFSDIQDNHLIEVKYVPYFKVVGKIDHGTITDDRVDIKKGENHTVTWTPEHGRYVTKVTVNGTVFYETDTVTKNYPMSYEFKDIGADCDIVVETAPIPEEITVQEITTIPETTPEETTVQKITTVPETTLEVTTPIITTKSETKPNSYSAPKTGGQAYSIFSIICLIVLIPGIVMMKLIGKKSNK